MLINTASLDLAFKGFQTRYNDGFSNAAIYWDKVAMKVSSSSRDETCGWIGQMPAWREWVGPRIVNNLSAQKFTITNRKFESTIAIKREDFADDRLGVFGPMFANMGELSRQL